MAVDWKPAFLVALATVPVVDQACDAVRISRGTAYRHRKVDKAFAQAWDDALEAGVDNAEAEVFRRAVDGFEEPVIHAGQMMFRTEPVVDPAGVVIYVPVLDADGQPVPLTKKRYSDQLLILIMKGRRRSLYASRVELAGADGGQLEPHDETTRAARMTQLLAVARARQVDEVPGDFDLA